MSTAGLPDVAVASSSHLEIALVSVPGPQFTTGGEKSEQSWGRVAEMFRWFLEIRDFFDKNSSTQLRKSLKTTWPEAETINLNG